MDSLTEVTSNLRNLISKLKPEDIPQLIDQVESLIKLAWDERDCWAESERRLARACLERDQANAKFTDLRTKCSKVISMLDDATDLLED